MPRLVVKDNFNDPDLRNSVELIVNGLILGRFHPSGETEYSVAAGRHTIRLRVNGKLQVPSYLLVRERETVSFQCEAHGIFRLKVSLKEKSRRLPLDRFGGKPGAPIFN